MHSQALGHSTSNDAHSHTTFVLVRQRERLTARHYGHTLSLVNSVTAMRLSLACWYECQDQRCFIRNLGCDIRPVLFIYQPMSSFSHVFCLFLSLAKMLSSIEHLQRSRVFISSWNWSGSSVLLLLLVTSWSSTHCPGGLELIPNYQETPASRN